LTVRHFRPKPSDIQRSVDLLPISVLKPLKGDDPELVGNLQTFFELNYPRFEIIFSVADDSDPAITIVTELIKKYPNVATKLIIGDKEIGPNPKVNNMVRSYEEARHDLVLVSDSNVRVSPDYLKKMISQLQPGVGLVTGIVVATGIQSFGANLENVLFGTFYARSIILALWVNHTCVVGKSMLFRRTDAKRFGGLQMLSRYLAEDYKMGDAMKQLGLRVVLMREPVRQYLGIYSMNSFLSRYIRWGRIRKSHAPIAFLVEPFTNCFLSGLIGSFALNSLYDTPIGLTLSGHFLFWWSCDVLILRTLGRESGLQTFFYWFVRELLAFPLWIQIIAGNKVHWRGNQLKIRSGGLLEVLTPSILR
jgi:ceramide glucosyltransferase